MSNSQDFEWFQNKVIQLGTHVKELERELDEERKKATVIRGTRLRQGRWHKDYIIGVHWLSAAYERICAGERECEVMADYGYVDAARAAREEK